jgi:hypothetical protein
MLLKSKTQYIPGQQDNSINIQTVYTASKTTESTYRLHIQPARRQNRHTGCIYSQQDDSITIQTVRGLLEKYPTFGREKETGLLRALDT